MQKQRLLILGSTGSIGAQVLEIVRQHPDKFEIIGLTANHNYELLIEQIKEFKPKVGVICNTDHYESVKNEVSNTCDIHTGIKVLRELVQRDDVDTVLNSLVGFSGFLPTIDALRSGKKVALANKESLVVGGELIQKIMKSNPQASLVPVDSEHSAMLQSLVGEDSNAIENIIITASGGPFRDFTLEQMKSVTVEQALKHPNWDMGSKITIDSATMMNKGLEIIEAKWLFGIDVDKIIPVIHPQSIIHSMVTFIDGSTKAQLGLPDMKVPIIYALTFPNRIELDTPRMDWTKMHELTFTPVNYDQFPCIKLAIESIKMGGVAPAILNAANEVAVKRFLNKEIGYIDIARVVEKCLNQLYLELDITEETLTQIDKETRLFANLIN